jgi:hypothetical protein
LGKGRVYVFCYTLDAAVLENPRTGFGPLTGVLINNLKIASRNLT